MVCILNEHDKFPTKEGNPKPCYVLKLWLCGRITSPTGKPCVKLSELLYTACGSPCWLPLRLHPSRRFHLTTRQRLRAQLLDAKFSSARV